MKQVEFELEFEVGEEFQQVLIRKMQIWPRTKGWKQSRSEFRQADERGMCEEEDCKARKDGL